MKEFVLALPLVERGKVSVSFVIKMRYALNIKII